MTPTARSRLAASRRIDALRHADDSTINLTNMPARFMVREFPSDEEWQVLARDGDAFVSSN